MTGSRCCGSIGSMSWHRSPDAASAAGHAGAPARHDRQHHLGCGGECVCGVGRLRQHKAALEHASRILAAELDGSGVRVLVVDPGDMNTEMHAAATPGADLSELASPDEVAPAIVGLLDDATPSRGWRRSALARVSGIGYRVSAQRCRVPGTRCLRQGRGDTPMTAALDFALPPQLEAREPAEERGSGRDDVRMLVFGAGDGADDGHALPGALPQFLRRGDLVVLNTSATLPAALRAWRGDGSEIALHWSSPLPTLPPASGRRRAASGGGDSGGEMAIVELRAAGGQTRLSVLHEEGERLTLARGGRATILFSLS